MENKYAGITKYKLLGKLDYLKIGTMILISVLRNRELGRGFCKSEMMTQLEFSRN